MFWSVRLKSNPQPVEYSRLFRSLSNHFSAGCLNYYCWFMCCSSVTMARTVTSLSGWKQHSDDLVGIWIDNDDIDVQKG